MTPGHFQVVSPNSCKTVSVSPNLCHPCMQGKLPEWVQTLAGVAIPFGAFDAVLQDEANADVSDDFVKAAGFDGTADANLSNLDSIKTVIQTLRAPESLRQQLEAAFRKKVSTSTCMTHAQQLRVNIPLSWWQPVFRAEQRMQCNEQCRSTDLSHRACPEEPAQEPVQHATDCSLTPAMGFMQALPGRTACGRPHGAPSSRSGPPSGTSARC